MLRLLLSGLLALGLGACADSSAIDADGKLAGFGSDLPRFAVISRDDTYTSSSVGFLDADASPVSESWLDSGTVSPKLVETISGDAVFVTEERGDGTFTLVDRFGTDVVSRFDLASGEVLGQVRVRDAFAVNPYDVVYTDSGRAFVLRFGKNSDGGASDLDAGNDLLEIDPETAAIVGLDAETGEVGSRIDLSAFDVDVPVGDSTVTTYASPASALEVSGFLVIGLGRYSLDFAGVAEGAFVVHDLEGGTSELVSLPGLRDCSAISRVPGEPSQFAVHCIGAYGSPDPDKGVVVFELSVEGAATEVASYRLADHVGGEAPLDVVVVLDSARFFGIRFGAWGDAGDPDVGYLVGFADGEATEAMRSSVGGATLGRSAFDPDTGTLLVPDENEGIHHLDYDAGTLEHVRSFTFGPAAMNVRGIVRL